MKTLEQVRALGERETRASVIAVLDLIAALALWWFRGAPLLAALIFGVVFTPFAMLVVAICTSGAMWFAREVARRGEDAALDIALEGGRQVATVVLFVGGIWLGPSLYAWLVRWAFGIN